MSWTSGRMWLQVGSYEQVGFYEIDTSNGPTSQDDSIMKDQNASLRTLLLNYRVGKHKNVWPL